MGKNMIDFQMIRRMNKQQQDLGWRIIRAEARATRSTTTITGMPRSGNNGNKMENMIVEIATLKESYIEICEKLAEMKKELEKKLPALKNPYVQVSMRMRYIKGMKIKDICETLSYSDRQVIRFLKQGEQEINREEE